MPRYTTSRFVVGGRCLMASGKIFVVADIQHGFDKCGDWAEERTWVHFKDPEGCSCQIHKDIQSNSLESRRMPRCDGKHQCCLTTHDFCDKVTKID